jgi:ATP-binding protein involved in chromosome partitioning
LSQRIKKVFGFKRSLKREDVWACLEKIEGVGGQNLVLSGLIESISIAANQDVIVTIAVPKGQESAATHWQSAADTCLRGLKGVGKVLVVLTAHVERADVGAPPPAAPSPEVTRVRKGARLSDAAQQQGQVQAPLVKAPIPGITAIIAVASAKGGVGKSTVAVNLAVALAALGLRVGLLDSDIYGPSIPTMLGTGADEPATGPDKKLLPIEIYGIKTMSIGYMVDTDAPMIWRGPIVASAIRQLLEDVTWGSAAEPLDILVMDTPPGTGDAQLTLAQKVPLNGAVIVSTPQEVALADVRRGAAMFAKTHVPILGVIENMAWLVQQDGSKLHVFGQGGAKAIATDLALPFLGEIPLDKGLRESGDAGVPYVIAAPGSEIAGIFLSMAAHIHDALVNADLKPPPSIAFEA